MKKLLQVLSWNRKLDFKILFIALYDTKYLSIEILLMNVCTYLMYNVIDML